MADLFGRYCYIDTPWIAGKKTRYRILSSGLRSNSWCEVPVTGRTEPVTHFHTEELVLVVLDTLVSDDSIIRRFALKDIELIPADVVPIDGTAYGYPVKELVVFAEACRVAGVGPEDLKDFVRNIEAAYAVASKAFDEHLTRCFADHLKPRKTEGEE